MIGLYLILIGLVIIYLTTPKNRKKIRNQYLAISSQLAYTITRIRKSFTKDKANRPNVSGRKSKPKTTIAYESDNSSGESNFPAQAKEITSRPKKDIPLQRSTNTPPATARPANHSHQADHKKREKAAAHHPNGAAGLLELINGQTSNMINTVLVNAREKILNQQVLDTLPLAPINKQEEYTANQAPSIEDAEHNENDIITLEDTNTEIDTEKLQIEDIQEQMDQSIENETEAEMEIDDFIDIEEDDKPIDQEKLNFDLVTTVPYWPHRYIYALSDLDYANENQRNFYYKFRDTFFQGKCLDVLGNNNYVFILLFDLLDQYENHQDLHKLEEYIDRLSSAYPRTKGYGRRFLLEKMENAGDLGGITRLERRMVDENIYLSWDWKGRYKDKLNLGKREMDILSKIYLSGNNFVSIPFCGTELVKLYINTAKKLEDTYQAKGLKKAEEFHAILDLIARKEYRFHLNSANYNYQIKNGENGLYEYLAKYCEQLLRLKYKFKKLSGFDKHYSHQMVNEAVREHMLAYIDEYLPELLENVAMPDEQTEKALNVCHTTRWKSMLILEEEYYKQKGSSEFISQAEHLIQSNSSNPSLENILLELSKFLSGLDKQKSIEYFLRYIDQNLRQRTLTFKDMPKAMSKKLFSSPESHTKFINIMTAMIKREQTLEGAMEEIKGFYEPVRKKISLNTDAIKKIQHDFSATADVLSELLSDEEEPVKEEIDTTANHSPEAEIPHTYSPNPSLTAYQIELSEIEVQLLQLFQDRALILTQEEIDTFCQQAGATASVLVNNINEQGYDLLDDLLIEKETDTYTINSAYYKQIEKI
ncbi:MAG: hypothetical protein EOO20_01955 [Chryseobacterium sp.]|nr:MAG: hypothetical protein EOO20_01955 [Chryseobacterium sp.]